MVPQPDVHGRRQSYGANTQRVSTSPLLRRASREPKITYGKKNTRLLSLTANQFRSDIFNTPSDAEEADSRQDQARALARATSIDDHARNSGLSGALQPTRALNKNTEYGRGSTRKVYRNTNDVATNHARYKGVYNAESSSKGKARAIRTPETQLARRCREPVKTKAATRTTPETIDQKKVQKKPSKARAIAPARRLPVNELFLVNSPGEVRLDEEPRSTYHGIHAQDLIQNTSSSPRKRKSCSSSLDGYERRQKSLRRSLTVLRGLFKPPSHRRRKRRSGVGGAAEDDIFETVDINPRGCDGFEQSELAVKPQFAKRRRRPSQKERLIYGFQSLHLQGGPLPDVEFEPSTAELPMSHDNDYADEMQAEQAEYDDAPLASASTPKRRTSSNDPMRESRIRAELSSIHAPERVPSESDESDRNEEDDANHDENENDNEEEVMAEYDVNDSDLLSRGNERAESSLVQVIDSNIGKSSEVIPRHRQIKQIKPTNEGVTLDFRQPLVPGQLPRQPLGRKSLVEVEEAIIEVPESPTLQNSHLLSGCVTRVSSRRRITQPDEQTSMRRRSILRSSTAAVPESTTGQEHTAANTRRNSLVNAAETRYFTNATNTLGVPHPTGHKIIPRRGSLLANEYVEVPYTGRAVPETSPEPLTLPHYTHQERSNVLKENEETQQFSKLLSAKPGDLRSLTRIAHQEPRDLGGSIMRRASMSFQTPG